MPFFNSTEQAFYFVLLKRRRNSTYITIIIVYAYISEIKRHCLFKHFHTVFAVNSMPVHIRGEISTMHNPKQASQKCNILSIWSALRHLYVYILSVA